MIGTALALATYLALFALIAHLHRQQTKENHQ